MLPKSMRERMLPSRMEEIALLGRMTKNTVPWWMLGIVI